MKVLLCHVPQLFSVIHLVFSAKQKEYIVCLWDTLWIDISLRNAGALMITSGLVFHVCVGAMFIIEQDDEPALPKEIVELGIKNMLFVTEKIAGNVPNCCQFP